MQDSFLFDSDDPKQIGHGVDILRQDGDGLKADWKWTRGRGARMPATNKRCVGQISEAQVSENIQLEAVFWHNYYEARVIWGNDTIATYADDEEGQPLLTRIEAQRKAENLAREFVAIYSKEVAAISI